MKAKSVEKEIIRRIGKKEELSLNEWLRLTLLFGWVLASLFIPYLSTEITESAKLLILAPLCWAFISYLGEYEKIFKLSLFLGSVAMIFAWEIPVLERDTGLLIDKVIYDLFDRGPLLITAILMLRFMADLLKLGIR